MQHCSGRYGLAINSQGAISHFECHWKTRPDVLSYGTVLTLRLRRPPAEAVDRPCLPNLSGGMTEIYQYDIMSSRSDPHLVSSDKPLRAFQFLARQLVDLSEESQAPIADLKLIIPGVEGYVARNDVFERRLESCRLIRGAQTFVQPLQHIQPMLNSMIFSDLHELLPHILGGVILHGRDETALDTEDELVDAELKNRLSYSWILPDPLHRKRLALIHGRSNYENSARIWEAASALGVSFVVFDADGHWLQQPDRASLYEDFVATDITLDDGVVGRIVEAVKAYPLPFDGIMTFEQPHLLAVAQAAQALAFFTQTPEAIAVACDKFLTRELEPSASESFECSSVEQLQARLEDPAAPPVKFPLIVKPCTGWASACVTRAGNVEELTAAVARAVDHRVGGAFGREACVVEPFVDGPEFDANFVLLDGQLIFSDISDDYPSPGDSADAKDAGHFLETQIVLPTRLPENEQALIREQVVASIVRQGFAGGVFHCEGRVLNSSVSFQLSPTTGHYELVQHEVRHREEASVYLIENNSRAPAYVESVLVEPMYGIDLYAQHLLYALGPSERSRYVALADPFKQGAQFDALAQFIAPKRSGHIVSEVPGCEVFLRIPRLSGQDNLPIAYYSKKKGDWTNGPETGTCEFLAWYSVIGRTGLRDLMNLGAEIEKEYMCKLVMLD